MHIHYENILYFFIKNPKYFNKTFVFSSKPISLFSVDCKKFCFIFRFDELKMDSDSNKRKRKRVEVTLLSNDLIESCYSECTLCKRKFQNPIRLPCNNKICLRDLDELLTSKLFIKCVFCKREHKIPPDGFPLIKTIELNNEIISQQNVHVVDTKYHTELFNKDPKLYVKNHFANLKAEANAAQLKESSSIDNRLNKIMSKIDEQINEYTEELKQMSSLKPVTFYLINFFLDQAVKSKEEMHQNFANLKQSSKKLAEAIHEDLNLKETYFLQTVDYVENFFTMFFN